jgi:hypothetical protein
VPYGCGDQSGPCQGLGQGRDGVLPGQQGSGEDGENPMVGGCRWGRSTSTLCPARAKPDGPTAPETRLVMFDAPHQDQVLRLVASTPADRLPARPSRLTVHRNRTATHPLHSRDGKSSVTMMSVRRSACA